MLLFSGSELRLSHADRRSHPSEPLFDALAQALARREAGMSRGRGPSQFSGRDVMPDDVWKQINAWSKRGGAGHGGAAVLGACAPRPVAKPRLN